MSIVMCTSSSSSLPWQQQCRRFTFAEIKLATQNFDESLIIGYEGFGKVYKGTFFNGVSYEAAAVKRLDSMSNQGANEFWVEVKMLSKLRHCHLLSLIGYCNEGQEMILLYEYMPHGTLADHLHKFHTLSWVHRLRICIGAARGLDYLHTGTGINHGIIHRDVKSSNILLGKNWAAKISDFGLSKICPTNLPFTHVKTFVKGTFGYLDPDYFSTGRLTRKSDVYSFGIVLFEVLCGKHAVDSTLDKEQQGLARWSQDTFKEGRLKKRIDPNIEGEILPRCLKEFARLANRCLHRHPKQRPAMAEVVSSLELLLTLQERSSNSDSQKGKTIFGRKLPMFLLPSNWENSGRGRRLETLDFNFYTDGGERIQLLQFKLHTLMVATENFSKAVKTRGGRSYSMYKGRLLNGQGIAVKVCHFDCLKFHEECENEVSLLVKLEHTNLVRLLGYCREGTKMLLVYGAAVNASLDYLIFDPLIHFHLDWNKRHKIILGVARGLLYLHKHAPMQILHCGVQPGNILLDENLDAKITAFGVARCLAMNDTEYHDVNRICRTMRGYMAPEYLLTGHLSTKTDVFSFGVLVLETIGGQRSNMCSSRTGENFVQNAWRNWWRGTYSNIVDLKMGIASIFMKRYIEIGLLCLQDNAAERPTMDQVVNMLISDSSLTLPVPKKPVLLVEDWVSEAWESDHDVEAVDEFVSKIFNDHDLESSSLKI